MRCFFLVLLVLGLSSCLAKEPLYKFSDAYIDQINREAETWTAGRNFAANMTEEYLRKYIIGPEKYYSDFEQPLPSERKMHDPAYDDVGPIPKSFDAREHWSQCSIIKKVPDVGACAAPQIYAATAAFSDRLCIKSNGKHDIPLSTEYVVGCCKICRYHAAESCSPGSVYRTWHFLHKRGSVTGGYYGEKRGCLPATIEPCAHHGTSADLKSCEGQKPPQVRCHTRCLNEGYRTGFFQDKHRSTMEYWVKETEENIMKEILAHGPTTVTFALYDDFFHYKSGVYQHTASAQAQTYLQSAKLIGWGEENGTPYWLLINTWGPNWGDKGTVKFLRGKFECAIEYLVAAGVAKY